MGKHVPGIKDDITTTDDILDCETYHDVWAAWYTSEVNMILRMVHKNNIERINHIGGTVIPGLLSRPVIDILLEITRKCNLDGLNEMLEEIGYIGEDKDDCPSPHMVFRKESVDDSGNTMIFHLYVRFKGDWDELYFRDYLLLHGDKATEYSELKRHTLQLPDTSEMVYVRQKVAFFNECIPTARKEFWHKYLT